MVGRRGWFGVGRGRVEGVCKGGGVVWGVGRGEGLVWGGGGW